MGVVRVSSWKEAIDRRGSIQASNAFLEGGGMLTRSLGSDFRSDYQKWNRIAYSFREGMEEQILPDIDALVDSTTEIAVEESGPHLIKNWIRWDLAHYCMERAYAELVKPRFYSEIFEVYREGHFPCDWNEVWPNGKLWIL
jgi:hypothetical protein